MKLLIDAIQSSKFITQSKSKELISKIKTFVSIHQARLLQRQIVLNDRVKTMNESVYYNVDDIYNAINQNKKIRFKYLKWDINKQLVPEHNNEWTTVSPWELMWDDENYYLIAYDDGGKKIKHYRVDKMKSIELVDEKRFGSEEFNSFDMAKYSKATFGMYGGECQRVCIQFENSLCGVLIDRFGKDISFRRVDDTHSELQVDVNVSQQFFGWMFSLGPDIKVTAPASVVKKMHTAAEKFLSNYT